MYAPGVVNKNPKTFWHSATGAVRALQGWGWMLDLEQLKPNRFGMPGSGCYFVSSVCVHHLSLLAFFVLAV
jgi:hypothetical protein